MIKQFREKLHYFRVGKTLQEDKETAEHITCTPPGTLSNRQQRYLCMGHCCTGKSRTSLLDTQWPRQAHTLLCYRNMPDHKIQRAAATRPREPTRFFPAYCSIPKADFHLLVLSGQHTPSHTHLKLLYKNWTAIRQRRNLHLEDDLKSGCYQINKDELSESPKAWLFF